jgi:hypothetical protein
MSWNRAILLKLVWDRSCIASFSNNADRTVSRDALSGCFFNYVQIFGKRCLSLHASPQYPSNRQVSGSESFLADSLGLSRSTWLGLQDGAYLSY